jgi:hypothetical protein
MKYDPGHETFSYTGIYWGPQEILNQVRGGADKILKTDTKTKCTYEVLGYVGAQKLLWFQCVAEHSDCVKIFRGIVLTNRTKLLNRRHEIKSESSISYNLATKVA